MWPLTLASSKDFLATVCIGHNYAQLWNASSCQQRNIFKISQPSLNWNLKIFLWQQKTLETFKFHVFNFNFCAVVHQWKWVWTWREFSATLGKKMRLHSAGLSFGLSWPQHLTSVKVVGRVSKEDLVVRKERKKSTWPQFSKVMGLR